MGRKGQAALGAGAHEEEFAELQRRFDALSSAKKLSETSPALLTKDMYRTEKKQQAVRRDDPQLHAQLKTLDEQIVQLRRRHDRLHDNNNKKRRELDLLADRLQDLHNSAFKSEDAPQVRLRAQEERLVAAAHRYEESHRTKLTYEQVIERLKTELASVTAERDILASDFARHKEHSRAKEDVVFAVLWHSASVDSVLSHARLDDGFPPAECVLSGNPAADGPA